MSESPRDRAARAAVAEVKAGMIVGLGSGDTASRAITALGALKLPVVTVATSEASAALARQVGLTVRNPDEVSSIDLTIDGADEIDPQLRLIKGAGGALTREKLVAHASKRLIIVADAEKKVAVLGEKRRLPIEILSFGHRWTLQHIGMDARLREGFVTDNAGLIADCALPATDLYQLARMLESLPGVIEHGLFLDEAAIAYIGNQVGVEILAR